MELLFIIFAVFVILCFVVPGLVYDKQKRGGKNPWGWTIASFFITAIVLFGALVVLAAFAFRFER
jgi:RsiW-degrading membrane proteinase PrsW (M82 family)